VVSCHLLAMLELSACIEWLFAAEEPEFAARISRAAAAGVPAVEFWTWRDKDLGAVQAKLAETRMQVEGLLSQPEGRLVDPATHDDFLQGVVDSAPIAASLGCPNLIVLAGDRLDGIPDSTQRAAVVEALKHAAPIAAQHGVRLLLEPLNTRIDHVGHFLEWTADGLTIVEEVDAPNVLLLLDLYHSAVMDERLDEAVYGRIDLVGHVHVADTQGRHEPGTGTVDWPATIGWLLRAGYTGRLGLEYMPTRDSAESLSFLRQIVTALR
jgi:hydroxypyruvate isomerase